VNLFVPQPLGTDQRGRWVPVRDRPSPGRRYGAERDRWSRRQHVGRSDGSTAGQNEGGSGGESEDDGGIGNLGDRIRDAVDNVLGRGDNGDNNDLVGGDDVIDLEPNLDNQDNEFDGLGRILG
jgi:hypothetical protein